MTPELLEAILSHARAELPRESCGLIVKAPENLGYYVPCRNVGEADQFLIHPEDWVEVEERGHILAVVHSHPGGPLKPSEADRESQKASGLPWYIVEPDTGRWLRFGELETLAGRPFAWGVSDCYSLAQDAFGGLRDFLRSDRFWKSEDLFMSRLTQAGFSVIEDDPQPGDGLLFAIQSETVNHCAIYKGDGRILHHLPGRLSVEEPMGAWVKCLRHVIRRKHV